MKIKSLSFLASCFIAACLYSCAGENNTAEQPDNGKQQPAPEGKAFVGFIDSTAAKAATRTGGVYGPLSNPSKTGIRFYWKTNEAGYAKMQINVGTDATPKWADPRAQKTLGTDAAGHITQVLFYNFYHKSIDFPKLHFLYRKLLLKFLLQLFLFYLFLVPIFSFHLFLLVKPF